VTAAADVRIALDASCLNAPMGGYERYVVSLLGGLAALSGDEDYVVVTDREYGPTVVPHDGRVRVHPVATLPRFILKVLLQDQSYWPALFRQLGATVIHTPIFAGMWRAPRPYVLTLHDLVPLRDAASLTRSAAWYWRTVLPRAVARADAIITDSEFSRAEIVAHFAVPSDRVIAIPLGVEARFAAIADRETLEDVRRRHALPERFLLFVGMPSPRKNVDRLVRVFATLPRAVRADARLVLVGPPGWKNAALDRELATPAARACVQRLGVVSDHDLPALYTLATGAVNLSRYEGFGLPALEALACGTPLVCARASAFPEVVGDCALLVPPTDDDAIAAGLTALLAPGADLAARRARGIERARRFTWRRTAAETLAVYRRVAR
jgi:alpha-1,3-rhamnosyl/mannosyltransferase